METNKLSQKINEIEMSEQMKIRIINNCKREMEERLMGSRKTHKSFKRPVVAIASMAVCFCLVGITALAATGKLEGYFKDNKRWDGAVTGTSYEQATEEINMSVASGEDKLAVTVELVNPNKAPYMTFETFGIEEYKIMDVNGNVIVESASTELAEIDNGKVVIEIPISELPSGDYKSF